MDDSSATRSGDGLEPEHHEPEAGRLRGPAQRDGFESGSHVGRYVILYRLGRGGMGIVYAAYDPQLDRKVAIKVLRTRRSGRNAQGGQDRMLREAQLLAKLSHPNVVAIHDVGIVGEQLFVAMEYIEGQTLRRWLQARERTTEDIVAAFGQAADGLAAAHRAGIVHQDFKPDNAIIDDSGRVHVLDFGLARVHGDSNAPAVVVRRVEGGIEPVSGPPSPTKTRAGMLGTPAYMSPEQHLGEPAGPASDQFSLCVALYEALFGRLPFAGSDHAELALNVTKGVVRDPPRHARTVSTRLRRLLWQGMSVEPAERHPSIEALAIELRRAPAPRRIVWIATAAVALGAAAWWSVHERPAGPCSGGASRLEGAWDASRRETVTRVFEASRRPHAGHTLRAITAGLDSWSDGWVDAWTHACEATHVRHEQSDLLLDLRMTCLHRKLDELEALTRLLAEADDQIVDGAMLAVDALPVLTPCADAEALRERVPAPDDAASQARIAELQALLAHAAALEHAGKNEAARRAAQRLVEQTRELGYAPLLAEALLQLGEILEGAADHEGASRVLREAAAQAEIARDDRLLAHVRVLLVLVEGDRLAKSERGRLWAELARATLTRLGGAPEIESTLENNLAFVVERDAPAEVVLEHRQRALALFDQAENPRELHRATLVANLAGTLADVGRFDEALHHAEEAHATWERILGPEHRKTAIGLSTIGLVHDFAGNRHEALAWYERAHAGLERALGSGNLHTTDVLTNIAIASFQLGDYARAEAAFREVLTIREQAFGSEHPDVAAAHANLAECLRRDHPREALHHQRAALDLRKRIFGSEHVAVAGSLSGIANILEELGRHEEALELRLEALTIEQALYGHASPELVVPLANTAHNRLQVGDTAGARIDAERALDLATTHERKDDVRAFSRIVLAKILAVQQQDAERVRSLVSQAVTELGDLPAPAERRLLADIETHQKRRGTP